MFARLRHEIPKPLEHLITHSIGQTIKPAITTFHISTRRHRKLRGALRNQRVQIARPSRQFLCKLQIKRHVVDTSTPILKSLRVDTNVARQLVCGVLHAVAQTNGLNARCSRYCPAQHAHRVHIVQQQCIRAQLFHVFADIQHHRNGAQPAHDSTDSQCVGNRLLQPVFLRYLKINHR